MNSSHKKKGNANPQASGTGRRRLPRWGATALAVILVGAIGFWWSRGPREDAPPSATPSPGFDKLKGRWQRPDGGYIVEIRSVEPDGRIDAGYFNPQPIHVAKAEAAREGAVTKLFIELRDQNYPGSTYNLVYQEEGDQLVGVYYQAALQQQFEVVFLRME